MQQEVDALGEIIGAMEPLRKAKEILAEMQQERRRIS
jgi:hypothetical protein